MAARLTPDQKVGSSNLSALIFGNAFLSLSMSVSQHYVLIQLQSKPLVAHHPPRNKHKCTHQDSNPGHKHGRLV